MHTKGKWEVVHGRDNDLDYEKETPNCITIDNDSGWHIARIWLDVDNRIPEAEANAELIAAAPDLLEACQGVAEIVIGEPMNEATLNKVQQAIKKAGVK